MTTFYPEHFGTFERVLVKAEAVTGDSVSSVSGDTGLFEYEFVGGVFLIYLMGGAIFDYESQNQYSVTYIFNDESGVVATVQVIDLPDPITFINVFAPPIAENGAPGAAVATLSAFDQDASDIHVFQLVSGLGDDDNAAFSIVGNQLKLNGSADYETKSSYSVRVWATDGDSTFETSVALTVTDLNEAPTLALANELASLAENTAIATDTKVADVVVEDDALGSYGLTLSGADAIYFDLVGNELFLKAGVDLDFETKASYSVTVEADDPTIVGAPDATAVYTLALDNISPEPLNGTVDDNLLIGGDDIDLITGFAGKDTMTGGGAGDHFIFMTKTDSKNGALRDVITDFDLSDLIDLSAIDANTRKGGDQAFKFIGTKAFHHKAGELRYTKQDPAGTANDKTIISGDVNGDGKADFQIELAGVHTLIKADFIA